MGSNMHCFSATAIWIIKITKNPVENLYCTIFSVFTWIKFFSVFSGLLSVWLLTSLILLEAEIERGVLLSLLMLASTAVTNPDQLIVSSIPCFNQERSNFNLQQTTYLLTVMDKNCATFYKDASKWETKMKAKFWGNFQALKNNTLFGVWKKTERYVCCTETAHIWLHAGKAKMRLRVRNLFQKM